MKPVQVVFDPGSGAATIHIPAGNLVSPDFRIRDVHKPRYLGPNGWSRVSVFMPCAAANGEYRITLAQELATLLAPGMVFSVEESQQGYKARFEWPEKPAPQVEKQPDPPAPDNVSETSAATTAQNTVDPPPAEAQGIPDHEESIIPSGPVPFWQIDRRAALFGALAGMILLAIPAVAAITWVRQSAAADVQARQACEQKIDNASSALDQSGQKIKDLTTSLSRAAVDANNANLACLSKLSDLEAQRDAANARYAEVTIEQRFPALPDTKSIEMATSEDTASDSEEVDALNKLLDDASRENDALKARVAALETRVSAAAGTNEGNKAPFARNIENLTNERDTYKRQVTSLYQELRSTRVDLAGKEHHNRTLQDQIDSLKMAYDEVSREKNRIEGNSFYPPVRTVWGAAAIDAKGIIYTVSNQITADSALEIALSICRGNSSSGRSCRREHVFANQCLSVTRISNQGAAPNNYAWMSAGSWQEAEQGSLNKCQHDFGVLCSIRFTVCSPDRLSKPE